MTHKTVLILGHIDRSGRDLLERDGRFHLHCLPDHAEDRFSAAATADAIIVRMTPINEDLLASAPKLQFVSRHGVGHDTVDKTALTARGIPLSITGDVNSGAVAEHAMALMLASAKRIVPYDAATKAGDFDIRDTFSATELSGKTILLIGFGRIGRKVAHMASAFGMRIAIHDPFLSDPPDDAVVFESLDEGLKAADYVTLHAPKTDETTHLIGATELAAIKPGAVVINVARGGLVDEGALLAALDNGRVRAAALDVFETEPPAADAPILAHPNLIATPHSAAFTAECAARMSTACAANVIDYFDNRLDNTLVVNKEALSQNRQTAQTTGEQNP